MRGAWAIAKREVSAFFNSVTAYVVMTVWLLWSGITYYFIASWYAQNFTQSATASPLADFFGGTVLFYVPLMAFVPMLTMRLLAEERSRGSIELLFTAPVSSVHVVLGKYAAAMLYWVTLWLPTLLYVWITSRFGDVDLGAVAASYAGIFGIGLYYMAAGLLMSAIAPHQIVAAVLTFMFLALLFIVGAVGQGVASGDMREVLSYISVWQHMSDFARGVVDTRYIVYDSSLAALMLFITVRVVEGRRGGA